MNFQNTRAVCIKRFNEGTILITDVVKKNHMVSLNRLRTMYEKWHISTPQLEVNPTIYKSDMHQLRSNTPNFLLGQAFDSQCRIS